MHRIFKASNIILDTQAKTVDNTMPDFPPDSAFESDLNDNSTVEETEKTLEHAKKEAARIIKRASEDAEKILSDAIREAAKIKTAAEDEGRNSGYDAGYSKGASEAEKLKKDAERLYQQALTEREEMIDAIEPQMLELTIGAIKKFLNDAMEINPKVLQNLIAQGLSESSLKSGVIIHVSTEDYDSVLGGKELFLSKIESGSEIDIRKDPTLNKSDCIIETPFGDIDCSLDQQFESLRQSLYLIYDHSSRAE